MNYFAPLPPKQSLPYIEYPQHPMPTISTNAIEMTDLFRYLLPFETELMESMRSLGATLNMPDTIIPGTSMCVGHWPCCSYAQSRVLLDGSAATDKL